MLAQGYCDCVWVVTDSLGQSRAGEPGITSLFCCMSDPRKQRVSACVRACALKQAAVRVGGATTVKKRAQQRKR